MIDPVYVEINANYTATCRNVLELENYVMMADDIDCSLLKIDKYSKDAKLNRSIQDWIDKRKVKHNVNEFEKKHNKYSKNNA